MAKAALFLRSLWLDELPILAYHRICDVPDESRFPFDVELISASTENFAWQMRYIKRNFSPITFADLIKALDNEAPLPPKPIIVTFDDGFDDNYFHAFPILKELGVPATFFIATDYIGKEKTFWYDWLAYIILHLPPSCPLFLDDAYSPIEITGDVKARRAIVYTILEYLKHIPDSQRIKILNRVNEEYGQIYTGNDLAFSKPLTWDHVREMAHAGMEIGSHTVTHPILIHLSDSEIRMELTVSKEVIEREIGRPVQVIAYPIGCAFAFDDHVGVMAKKAGYRLGISFVSGINNIGTLEKFALKRIPVSRYIDKSLYISNLSFPELFL
jgi:peptidoglycan/xylan/chitin deacetylase (PgdA/CDA1 family)